MSRKVQELKKIREKIISLIVCIIMLSSYFVTLRGIWATNELEKEKLGTNEQSQTSETSENAINGTEENKEETHENSKKDDEEENEKKTEVELEEEKTIEKEEATNVEEVKTSEEVSQNSNEEVNNKIENQASNSNRVQEKMLMRNLQANLLATTPVTAQDLDKSIKATTKEDIEGLKRENKYKTKNDRHEIRMFETQFINGADRDANGNLVFSGRTAGHEFTFRVNYSLSGYGQLPAGTVQITIPKHILRNREGNIVDLHLISVPTIEQYVENDVEADLIYKEDDEYLVIYNPKGVDAGFEGYFDVAYTTQSKSYEFKDYNPSNAGFVKDGGTASDNFFAIMRLDFGEDSLNSLTDGESVYINTEVELESTEKHYPTIYREWDESWTHEKPEDSDQYYYLIWEIESWITYNPTQRYNFILEDILFLN